MQQIMPFVTITEPQRQKTYFLTDAPTKTQISLRIRAVYQRLRCPHEENLCPWLSKMRPVKILISPRERAG